MAALEVKVENARRRRAEAEMQRAEEDAAREAQEAEERATREVHEAVEAEAEAVTTHALEPPTWSDATAMQVTMTPRSAPVAVPFGRRHAVRTILGPSRSALWCYVFGTAAAASKI